MCFLLTEFAFVWIKKLSICTCNRVWHIFPVLDSPSGSSTLKNSFNIPQIFTKLSSCAAITQVHKQRKHPLIQSIIVFSTVQLNENYKLKSSPEIILISNFLTSLSLV